jgi:hypothetical protein
MTERNGILLEIELAEQIDKIIAYEDASELNYVPFYIGQNDGTTVFCKN